MAKFISHADGQNCQSVPEAAFYNTLFLAFHVTELCWIGTNCVEIQLRLDLC